MKKLIISVAIPIIIVTTMLVSFVGAAMLDLTADQWTILWGGEDLVIEDGFLVLDNPATWHVWYQFDFTEANQTTEGSYEFDLSFGEGAWMGFGKVSGDVKDLVQIETGGDGDALTLTILRADGEGVDVSNPSGLYNAVNKVAISYIFDATTQMLTQTVYMNGVAVATDVQQDYSDVLGADSKFTALTVEGHGSVKVGNIKWSSDPQEFVPGTGTEPTTEPTTAPTTEPTTEPGDSVTIVYFMMLMLMSLAVLLFTLKNKKMLINK